VDVSMESRDKPHLAAAWKDHQDDLSLPPGVEEVKKRALFALTLFGDYAQGLKISHDCLQLFILLNGFKNRPGACRISVATTDGNSTLIAKSDYHTILGSMYNYEEVYDIDKEGKLLLCRHNELMLGKEEPKTVQVVLAKLLIGCHEFSEDEKKELKKFLVYCKQEDRMGQLQGFLDHFGTKEQKALLETLGL
jgi:hypothetical protein